MTQEPPIIWTPRAERAEGSALWRFIQGCGARRGRPFDSVEEFEAFTRTDWRTFWRWWIEASGMLVEGSLDPACTGDAVEEAEFFPDLRLNMAENLLRDPDESIAIVQAGEGVLPREFTRREIAQRVVAQMEQLASLGVGPGDRVVALARNDAATAVAALATMGLGAAWSSVAPDLGLEATLSRFGQLAPVLLFAHGRYEAHGARHALGERIEALAGKLPSLRSVALLDDTAPPTLSLPVVHATGARDVPADGPVAPSGGWQRFPFNQPAYVLFSSGTTGQPKCIVHGAGGTLLEHAKEHALHGDLRADDRMLFVTSPGWMMWQWQLSALFTGASIVTYDGSTTFPVPDQVLRVADALGVTVFGTSPTYLQALQDLGIRVSESGTFAQLRAVLSTGSVLFERQFDWVMDAIKPVQVQSISGGTDIIGCFVLGNPLRPVRRGDSQGISLGYDVRVAAGDGTIHQAGKGELVCCQPFPSRPLGLFNDDGGTRFHDAYFSGPPGVWTHGDVVTLRADGGARIHGRSDGTLNVRGIRIGPAEIYNVVLGFPEVARALAVEQAAPTEPGGSRLVLLLVLTSGHELDRPLTHRIKRELKERASANHVPAVIAAVPDLPVTFSGKLSETSVRDALARVPVRNESALRNPECLTAIRDHPALQL